jgi:class 3 adenylate cyclase/tetratricopeptide (TPR) repeat protein
MDAALLQLVSGATVGDGTGRRKAMEYRVLGPLEVLDASGQKVSLGGVMQQSVLVALLLRAGRTVALDRLVDELWEEPPATALKTAQVYVSRLRQMLPDGAIESSPGGGYALILDGDELDLNTFERWAEEGHVALATGEWEQASSLLREALAVWRGPALAGLTSEALRREAEWLEERRLSVLEDRIEADLGSARHGEIVPELKALVAEHPFREHLRAQLMRALYRSGRPGDALALYRENRRFLIDELGMEPGQELRELEQAILRQDAGLEAPTLKRSVSPAEPLAAEPGPPLAQAVHREVRKTVTVLFCDVVGSTAVGESTDPEVLRALLARYFERMKTIVERHGGVVEKFIGDAVMAVFGVPVAHEDDAMRACRAASEMRETFPELTIEGRVGITTGEVITGTEERLATGDPVNTAVRLQETSNPGEVLIGASTLQLVRKAVEVEALEPLELRGKAHPVEAYRLLAVHEAPERRHEARFVGREQELAAIREARGYTLTEQRCELFTIVGEAGVGKSRLAAEALASMETPTVQGRCLPYGEGITYWPVIEVIKQLDVLPADSAAASAINSLLGKSEAGPFADEIAWAFRKLLEEAAPLVVVFDDIQWGEENFLDLLEHVAYLSRGKPLLLLCLARPDLLDRRPGWPAPVRLGPLDSAQSDQLIEQLHGHKQIEPALRDRILAASAGNPLFVEEMVAMLSESEGDEVRVPPTIQALLAARLDQLDPGERGVLERGAVEGEIFHRGAVQTLAPQEPHLSAKLTALVRKDFVLPDNAQLPGEDAFRFRHLLIRDAAYDTQPKSARAELHERYATWLEQRGEDLIELDEILGYHLEQAWRYRHELGDTGDPALAAAARGRLTTAEQRALSRRDFAAALNLAERTLALVTPDEIDPVLEVDRIEALAGSGRIDAALATARAAADRAAAAGDRVAELSLRLEELSLGLFMQPEGWEERLETLLEQALPELEAAGDDLGLYLAHALAGLDAINRGRADAQIEALERSLVHSRRLGSPHYDFWVLLADAYFYGSAPVPEMLSWLDAQEASGSRQFQLRLCRAGALAMLGRFDEARTLIADVRTELRERGNLMDLAISARWPSHVELLAGNPSGAERYLAEAFDFLEQQGERGIRATVAAYRAVAAYELGRLEEAEGWVARALELAGAPDLFTEISAGRVRAKVLARRGENESAERLARESVARVEETDFLNDQADAYTDLGEVLERAGKRDEASVALEQALALYERKGNLVVARRVRTRLRELQPHARVERQ